MEDFKVLPVRFDVQMYNEMRNLAHANQVNMSDIVRKGVEIILNESKKRLIVDDIAI